MQHAAHPGSGREDFDLWSAIKAARALDERGIGPDRVEVMVVNATPWHSIRVRNYETDPLGGTRLPLADLLEPIGVKLVGGGGHGPQHR